MTTFASRLLPGLIAVSFVFAGAGCSKQAKSARHLAEADRYFAAQDYDKAEVEYKNAFQADPNNAAAIGRLGVIYLDQGRMAQAFPYLLRAVELKPELLEARLKLGMLQLGTGRPQEAREAAEFVLTRNPSDPEAPLLLAEATANAEEAAAARTFLTALPAPAPSSAPVLVGLGMIDLRSGNPTGGKALFDQAQAVDPKYSAASAALGRFHLTQRNAAEAEKALQQAANLAPLRSSARLQFAQFLVQSGKVDEAKKVLEEATAKAPDFFPAWILQAEIAFNQRRFDDAVTQLNRVLARYSINPEATLLMSRVRLAQGETAKAVTLLESATTQFPQAAQMHLQLGLAYVAADDLPKATASFTQALALAPTFVQASLALAEVEMRQGNVRVAIASLQKLVQEYPKLAEAQLLLAQAFRSQGNLEEALKLFRNVDAAQTLNPMPSYQVGTVLLQLGRKAEARQALTRALTLAPGYIPALEQLTSLDVAEKNLPAARTRLEAELAKAPTSAPLHALMARLALASNDATGAEASLKKVIELAPDNPTAYAQLGQLYLATKQEDKALTNLQSVLAKNPKDATSAVLVGTLLEARRDYTGARDTYERLITANPAAAGTAYNNLAYIYAEYLNEPQKAVDAAQKARELLPNSPQVVDTLGWSLYKQGQYARALPFLQEAAAKLPEVADVHFHVGMGLYMLGDEAAARAALERSLQLDPKFAASEQARERLALLKLDLNSPTASAEVEKALKRDSADPFALALAGALQERKGQLNEALASYEAILKASPNNLGATLKTIQLYEAKKEATKALDLANGARRTFPSNRDIAHVLGRLVYKSGDHRRAVGLLQEAVRGVESPTPELLLDLAAATYAVGNVQATEAALRQALAANPSAPRATAAKTFSELVAFGVDPTRVPSAPQLAEAALKSDPADLPALYALALASETKNDVATARKHYELALKNYPEFAPAQKRLALIYAADPGQAQKAQELATRARQAYPNDAEVAKALGIAVYRQKNHIRAVSLLEEAVRQRGTDPEVHFYLGAAQLELKKTAEGKKSLEKAMENGLKGDLAAEAKKLLAAG